MRAICDSSETVVEFDHEAVTYRLLLPVGRRTFYLDVLLPDEHRPWAQRWTRYAMGRHDGKSVLRHKPIYTTLPLGAAVLGALGAALRYAATGQLERRAQA